MYRNDLQFNIWCFNQHKHSKLKALSLNKAPCLTLTAFRNIRKPQYKSQKTSNKGTVLGVGAFLTFTPRYQNQVYCGANSLQAWYDYISNWRFVRIMSECENNTWAQVSRTVHDFPLTTMGKKRYFWRN